LLFILAGWINRHQQEVLEYLHAENQVLKEKLGKKRILLTDDQQRRLAIKGKVLGRKALQEIATIVTPDTTLRLRSELALENLALRQQLAVLNRRCRRPKLRKLDRFFWVLLSRSWEHWKETIVIVKPETVLRWHRRRFASYWTRLSAHNGPGRPGKDREIRELIRKIGER
jgi:hypothetical protein